MFYIYVCIKQAGLLRLGRWCCAVLLIRSVWLCWDPFWSCPTCLLTAVARAYNSLRPETKRRSALMAFMKKNNNHHTVRHFFPFLN